VKYIGLKILNHVQTMIVEDKIEDSETGTAIYGLLNKLTPMTGG
jgi:hypothetical protein